MDYLKLEFTRKGMEEIIREKFKIEGMECSTDFPSGNATYIFEFKKSEGFKNG